MVDEEKVEHNALYYDTERNKEPGYKYQPGFYLFNGLTDCLIHITKDKMVESYTPNEDNVYELDSGVTIDEFIEDNPESKLVSLADVQSYALEINSKKYKITPTEPLGAFIEHYYLGAGNEKVFLAVRKDGLVRQYNLMNMYGRKRIYKYVKSEHFESGEYYENTFGNCLTRICESQFHITESSDGEMFEVEPSKEINHKINEVDKNSESYWFKVQENEQFWYHKQNEQFYLFYRGFLDQYSCIEVKDDCKIYEFTQRVNNPTEFIKENNQYFQNGCEVFDVHYEGIRGSYQNNKFVIYPKNAHGRKNDSGKPKVAQCCMDFHLALEEVSKIWEFGVNKYGLKNWREVDDAKNRYTDALVRHLFKEDDNEIDDDSKMLHAAHVAWNALARLHFILEEKKARNENKIS